MGTGRFSRVPTAYENMQKSDHTAGDPRERGGKATEATAYSKDGADKESIRTTADGVDTVVLGRVMADQDERRAAREDGASEGEISAESMRMLNDMERRMGMDYEAMCYAGDRNRAMRAKSARNKQKKARRRCR